jgi:GPH family glycoside/pentoside/hexuronide:cation symporter
MSDPLVSPQTPAKSIPKLRFGEKVAVGTGGLPIMFGTISVKAMAVPVYQMMLGVNPTMLGFVLAIPRLWDAFIDPLVGNWSDNTRTRWGRRRPFVAAGSITMALAYGAIWMVSPEWSETTKLAWLLGTTLVFYTCYAVFSVPYQSLTYEMSPDYDERTAVMGHSSFWYKSGELFYQWMIPAAQAAIFVTPLFGIKVVNWTVGLLVLGVVGVIPAIYGRERYFRRAAAQARVAFWPALRAALSNKAVLVVMALTALKFLANMFGSSMDYYLLVYYMFDGDLKEGSWWKGINSTAYAIVGIASIPLLAWMSRRFGKKATVIAIYALVIVAGVGKWFLYTPGVGWWLLLDPVLSGPILVAITMVMPSMMADACDDDELKHGQRREGVFGAVFMWIQKVGVAVGYFVSLAALDWVHFDVKIGGKQSPETFFWMRALLAGATSLTAAVAIVVALFYPITRERAEETRRQLEARRGTV